MAAAKALASSSPARDNPKHNLLPPVSGLREVAVTVALAVALQAHKEGLVTDVPTDQIEQRIRAKVWRPRYVPYRRASGSRARSNGGVGCRQKRRWSAMDRVRQQAPLSVG